MSKKNLTILIGSLLTICVCAVCVAFAGVNYLGQNLGNAFNNASDPANVKKIASGIADYTVPSGYKEIALDLLVYKYIMLTPDPKGGADGPFIMLMAMPKNSGANQEQMQQQMQRAFSQQTGQQASMQLVETRTVLIRGNPTKVSILQGVDTKSEAQIRQWITIFDGKSGPVLMMLQGVYPGPSWNEDLVNNFIASIK